MRFGTSTILAATVVALMAGTAHADTSATGTATATVIPPIAVTAGDGLNFGKLASGGSNGSVTSAGVASGGVTAISGPYSNGTFNVAGEPNAAYFSTVPLTATLAGVAVPANTLTANLSKSQNPTLNGGGTDLITVTGDLQVPANTPADTYNGTYLVSVNY